VLNSAFIFAPLLLGFVYLCEDLFFSAFYVGVFSVLHNIAFSKLLIFILLLIFFEYALKKKIFYYINSVYQKTVVIIFIYLFSIVLFGIKEFVIFYVFYNAMFDIILSGFFKCGQT
jgi:hypothetical protein